MIDPDEGKDPGYIQRRNWLLERMKRDHWDNSYEDKPKTKRGRKPSPIPQPKTDPNKSRNKFFKF